MKAKHWIAIFALTVALTCALLAFYFRDRPSDDDAYRAVRGAVRPNPPAAAGTGGIGPAAGDGAAAPTAAGGAPDVGFRAKKNGFSFENYGNDDGIVNLTSVEMRRLFGDAVCASMAKGRCHLTPAAREWMEELNDSMDDGHCEGLAVLSLLFFDKKASPADFGAATVGALKLEGNAKLQREIAYWFSLQEVNPTSASETEGLTPAQILDRLSGSFAPGRAPELYGLSIYKPEFQEGHAISPYSVVDRGGGRFAIGVYDSSFPGEERFVEVDRGKNTWQYQAGEDPKDETGLYRGDAETGTLQLTPLLVRLQKHECPFCGDADHEPEAKDRPTRRMHVIARGQAHVAVTDEVGHVTGRQGARLVNGIAGALITRLRGRNLRAEDREPTYAVPLGSRYEVSLDAAGAVADEKTEISMIGPGLTFEVAGIVLHPGQRDTMVVSKDRTEFTYRTAAEESPAITLGVSTHGADFSFTIVSSCLGSGQQLTLRLDQGGGVVSWQLEPTSGVKCSYSLEIERIDEEGSEEFSHDGLGLGTGDVVSLSYREWQGNGQTARLRLDVGGQGKQVQFLELSDEE